MFRWLLNTNTPDWFGECKVKKHTDTLAAGGKKKKSGIFVICAARNTVKSPLIHVFLKLNRSAFTCCSFKIFNFNLNYRTSRNRGEIKSYNNIKQPTTVTPWRRAAANVCSFVKNPDAIYGDTGLICVFTEQHQKNKQQIQLWGCN